MNVLDEMLGAINPSPTGANKWSVFALTGRWLSDVDHPSGFRLMEAGENYLAGISRDTDGFEHVLIYAVKR